MIDPTSEVKKSNANTSKRITRDRVLQALIFGLIFGFLLQKGGVAKYNILVGVLLFQDMTVIKVMVSAIIVGMLGLFVLSRKGKIELKLKPTRLASVTVGGLVFGAGFALSGYCPGTGAAALGQMNYDALFMVLGMILGSYLFAEASSFLHRTIDQWADYGKITLPDLVHSSKPKFVAAFSILLVAAIWVLETIK